MKSRKFIPLLWIAVAAAFGAVVMLLWNAIVPGIFGVGAISFWQALGLLVLARILFGGVGGRKIFGGMMMHGMHNDNMMHENVNSIREKWQKMSSEERKEFINKRKEHLGRFGHDFFRYGDCAADTGNNPEKGNE